MELSQIIKLDDAASGAEWEELSAYPGVKLLLRPKIHPDVQKAIRTGYTAAAVVTKEDGFADAMDAIDASVLARVAIVDWEGIGDKGKPLPYSEEKAEELIRRPYFREQVLQAQHRVTVRVMQQQDAIRGKSKGPSAGAKPTRKPVKKSGSTKKPASRSRKTSPRRSSRPSKTGSSESSTA